MEAAGAAGGMITVAIAPPGPILARRAIVGIRQIAAVLREPILYWPL